MYLRNGGVTMVELIIFCVVGLSLILAHAGYAVYYKAKTHSKKSLWRLMDEL